MNLPLTSYIRRLQEDTYPEIWSVRPMPAGSTFVLTIDGVDTVNGVVDTDTETVSFAIGSTIANADVGEYAWDLVMTANGWTRTLIQGTWTVVARSV